MLTPISQSNWNYTTAAHLLNRAGFGGPPEEIQELVRLGPTAAVARLLDYESIPEDVPPPAWAKPDPDRMTRLKAMRDQVEEQRKLLATAKNDEETYAINKNIAE